MKLKEVNSILIKKIGIFLDYPNFIKDLNNFNRKFNLNVINRYCKALGIIKLFKVYGQLGSI